VGTDSRRILIATVITVGIYLAFNQIFPPPKVAPGGRGPVAAAAPSGPASAVAVPPTAVAPVAEAPEELVNLEGEGFRAVLSSHGGALARLELLGKKFQRDVDGKATLIDLVRVAPGQPLPLAVVVAPELGGTTDPMSDPAARASMTLVSHDATSAVFEGRVGAIGLRKTYRLTGQPFELTLDLAVSGVPAAGSISVLYTGFMPPSTSSGGMFSGPALDFMRPACRAGSKTERFKVDGDQVSQRLDGATGWAGIDQHYFTSAVFPQPEAAGSCVFFKGSQKGSAAAALQLPVTAGTSQVSLKVFAGPKQLDLLKSYGRGFETAIDYGPVTNLFGFFAQGLLRVMRWFHGYIGNWGVAIILLTLTVKLLLYPLTLKSMQSMGAMRRLQPEIEKLKAKHGEDKQALNLAVMQLYQANKVNPLGGCLPMLLQMPVWFALYATLQTSVELYREPFLWMSDLTVKDPFFILPVAMGATSFIMQKLSPQPADNAQAKMMLYFFPAFFAFMMLFVPSGLTLYIFVNNLLSIVQQQVVNRMQEKAAPAKA
jgi:YidC/Oxa1 family membrane protein insertase